VIAPALAAALLWAAPPPAPAPEPAPLPDGDEEIVAHLEELERLDLLRNLELFDPGDEDPVPPVKAPTREPQLEPRAPE